MPKRLVILGANVTALAVARSARRWRVESWVVDVASGPACDSRYVKSIIDESIERLCAAVQELGRGSSAWLVSTADIWNREIVARRREFGAAFSNILNPSNEALEICLSKEAFAAWCAANGIPSPACYPIDPRTFEPVHEVAFPALVRPVVTQHAEVQLGIPKAREVRSVRELAECLEIFRRAGVAPLVTESLLDRRLEQISVGVALTRGSWMSIVSRKVRPAAAACRVGTLVEAIDDEESERLAVECLTRMGCEGICEVEILRDLDAKRCFVIEVNARPWVQFPLAAAAGCDLLGFLIREGKLPATKRSRPPVWLNFYGDLWNCYNRKDGVVRHGSVSFGAYLRSITRANTYAYWAIDDPVPCIKDIARIARPAWCAIGAAGSRERRTADGPADRAGASRGMRRENDRANPS